MSVIIKVFKEEIPTLRFIGKKYEDFGHWGEWWENGWFDLLEQTMGGPEQILNIWENGGGYIGVERRAEGQPFAYYIGMLTPEETPVPEGFVCIDFKGLSLGTCWIYGKESEVHDTSACRGKLEAQGLRVWKDVDGAEWSFENCLCPRYTTPDEQGNVILDYCYFVHRQDADAVVDSRCGLHCIGCEFKEPYHCGGCIETNGHPFHGECPVAVCCQEKELLHCGECEQMPCELLTQYSCDPEHGDTPAGARIEQCKRWKESGTK